MKLIGKLFSLAIVSSIALSASAQVESGSEVRRRSANDPARRPGSRTERMAKPAESGQSHEAAIDYLRYVNRQLDLTKPENAVLYYPEDIVDGQENLFRIILGLVVSGKIPAYEYLDGREIFTDQYRVKPEEMLRRFSIPATAAKGSTEKSPNFIIEEDDVPAGRVQNYYMVEKWQFDRNSNAMKTGVEALCPLLDADTGFSESVHYPMFWVKYADLKPYLATRFVFADDDNNLQRYSLDDYFTLGLYKGDIYKTRNLRNLTLAQMHEDPDDLARARDSIENRLRTYGKDLWVPSREEFLAAKEKAEAAEAAAGDIPERPTIVSATPDKKKSSAVRSRKAKKPAKVKQNSSQQEANGNAARSVRRRRR